MMRIRSCLYFQQSSRLGQFTNHCHCNSFRTWPCNWVRWTILEQVSRSKVGRPRSPVEKTRSVEGHEVDLTRRATAHWREEHLNIYTTVTINLSWRHGIAITCCLITEPEGRWTIPAAYIISHRGRLSLLSSV